MSFLAIILAVGATFAFMVIVANWIGEAIRRGAVDTDRRIKLEELVKLQKMQSEEMLKDKTVEDVVRDLDAGEF